MTLEGGIDDMILSVDLIDTLDVLDTLVNVGTVHLDWQYMLLSSKHSVRIVYTTTRSCILKQIEYRSLAQEYTFRKVSTLQKVDTSVSLSLYSVDLVSCIGLHYGIRECIYCEAY